MVINNKQLYKITLTREQLMLISQCVEDISRLRRETSGVSIWMWMILCINIITDNENKKDRMIIAYPSIIM